MYRVLIFSALLAVSIANPLTKSKGLDGRIVGGKNTTIKDAPYQVVIVGRYICGGSIISENLVLTAAHCLYGESLSSMLVFAGATDLSKEKSIHKIADGYIHDSYSKNPWGVPYNDIAIIKVSDPFKFDDTQRMVPLFASGKKAKPGTLAMATGYGTTSSGGQASEVLQSVTLPIMSKTTCFSAFIEMGGLPKGQICTSPVKGKDTCQGDSGGPLTINGVLVGIVSWGKGCADRKPGVFTEVAYYRDWIKYASDKLNNTPYTASHELHRYLHSFHSRVGN